MAPRAGVLEGVQMQLRDAESKASLVNRLRRIEGQVRGVENMINSERECR
mgnify:CR=1 FL=1